MPEQDELDSDEQRAQELLDRSHPKHRETEELQEELSAVWDLIMGERVTGNTLNRLFERSEVIFRVLKDRLNIEYPECERCGARSWGQEPGGPLRCSSCDRTPDEEVREQIHEKWREISGDESEAVVAQEPPHEVLGVEPDATPEEVREAFRKRVQTAHPDHGGDEQEFRRVREAREAMLGE